MGRLYTIGQVAEELGVAVQTIRDWEARGRIKAVRLPGTHRRFTEEELTRVKREMGLLPKNSQAE